MGKPVTENWKGWGKWAQRCRGRAPWSLHFLSWPGHACTMSWPWSSLAGNFLHYVAKKQYQGAIHQPIFIPLQPLLGVTKLNINEEGKYLGAYGSWAFFSFLLLLLSHFKTWDFLLKRHLWPWRTEICQGGTQRRGRRKRWLWLCSRPRGQLQIKDLLFRWSNPVLHRELCQHSGQDCSGGKIVSLSRVHSISWEPEYGRLSTEGQCLTEPRIPSGA